MYHDLVGADNGDKQGEHGYGKVNETAFEAHLRAMNDNFRVISVEDAILEIKTEGRIKENSVAITFDDGYSSAYHIAFPLLKKYDCTATIYLLTDWINGKMSLWWEELDDLIMGPGSDFGNSKELERIGSPVEIDFTNYSPFNLQARNSLLQVLSYKLMKTEDSLRTEIINDLRRILRNEPDISAQDIRPLTWDQVSEMSAAGIIFGAHTCSHINMSHADLETVRGEVSRSKNEIENRLGKAVKGFAYPYGYDVAGYGKYDRLLEELGLDYACTSWWGYNTQNTGRYQLFRNILPSMSSLPLLKRELYLNISEEPADFSRPPINYP